MADGMDRRQRDRAYERELERSYRRLKKQGATDDDADEIAREVANRSAERAKAPVFHTDQEFAGVANDICEKLAGGMSYYELFGDTPYLVGGRIDRVVSLATRTDPPVEMPLARAAKRATALERLSGGVAVLLFALALGTLGLWYAVLVGMVVSVAAEIYVQALMPRTLRKAAATYHVPAAVLAAAAIALIFLAYRWYGGVTEYPYLMAVVAAVTVVTIAFLIPGVVLGRLVVAHEARWRRDLERPLREQKGHGEGPDDR